jgi:hypothetical protein
MNNLLSTKPQPNGSFSAKAISLVLLLFLVFVSISLSACTTAPPAKAMPSIKEDPKFWEKRTMERANQRWAHIRAKEFEQAFAMYTQTSQKDFSAEMLSRQIAQTRMSNGIAESVECNEEVCEVTVNIEITMRIPRVGNKQQTVPFKEQWIVEAGEIRLLRN